MNLFFYIQIKFEAAVVNSALLINKFMLILIYEKNSISQPWLRKKFS